MSTAADPITDDRPAAEQRPARRRDLLRHAGARAHLVLPGVLTAILCFRAGGFFPAVTGLAAIAVAIVLLLRVTLAADPFAGWTRVAGAAALALACFASWTLGSALWSGAAARAIVEFDRALLYVLVLTLLATVPRRSTSLTVLLRWVLAAFVVVALAGLASRLAPGVFPISGRFIADRLAFPLTYWNATGVAAALGSVLALHHGSGEQEPRWMRIAATASLPVLVTALYFTFSRGAIAAGAIGVVAYALLAHPRRLLFTLAAALPCAVAALAVAYGADVLATERYFTGAGPDEGRTLALVLAGLTLAAAGIRWALHGLEERTERWALPRGRVIAGGVAACAVVVLVAALVLDAPGRIDRELDAFRAGTVVPVTGDARDRLGERGNNGRLDVWGAALEGFEQEPLHGLGAGTFRQLWQRERPNTMVINDGHSLYLEVLAELGVVGLLLLVAALLVPLVVAARRLRGPDRQAHAAFLAAAAVLLVHAGVDWDWEMPALWMWFFGAAGVVLAGSGMRTAAPSRITRVVAGLGCLLLAATPALVVSSQPALTESRAAFVRGDCGTAVDRALASLENLRVWAEAYEILGYCNLRGGEVDLALRSMQAAHDHDPDDWQFAYGLAIAQAFAGEDPRPAAALAVRLNPHEALAVELSSELRAADPERWPRVAARASIPHR
jgi:O-antigen ligase/polysaccharide polymerase Wzy-like membrane protein